MRKQTFDDDALLFALRMTRQRGGLRSLRSAEVWREFVRENILAERGYEPTERQLETALRGRQIFFERLPEVGFSVVQRESVRGTYLTFRDRLGRFVSAAQIRQVFADLIFRKL